MSRVESQNHNGSYSCFYLKKKDIFECTLCSALFKHNKDLKKHRQTHDLQLAKYKCDQPGCQFATYQKSNFRTHKKIHLQQKDQVCIWPCTEKHDGICGFACTDPSSLNRHIKRHVKRAIEKGQPIPEKFIGHRRRMLRNECNPPDAGQFKKDPHLSYSSGDVGFYPVDREAHPVSVASTSKYSHTFHASSSHVELGSDVDKVTPRTHDFPNTSILESSPSALEIPPGDNKSLSFIGFHIKDTRHNSHMGQLSVNPFSFPTNGWLSPQTIVQHGSQYTYSDPWAELHLLMQEAPSSPSTILKTGYSSIAYF